MFERQLTKCLVYGKCSINDSIYNDCDDKEEEGIMKDHNNDVFSSIGPSHLKKNCHLPSQAIRNRKACHCYFPERGKLLESRETIFKHNSQSN